ncbi:calmodulin-like [Ptychodera flava]|uniref:calmodulin-like n=1 Tax=Ptychodera flava TaxID=63121 RepID=UPI00396A3879
MAHVLTQKQIDEFKECFALYDRTGKGAINKKDLTTVMRSLGTNPTIVEIKAYLKQYEKADGKIHFDDFLVIMHQQLKAEDPTAEILEAFRRTDKQNRGFILAKEFKHIMTSMGEKLTSKEVDDLLREADVPQNGFVKYEEFVKIFTRPIQDSMLPNA